MTREMIEEIIMDLNPDALFIDGFDDAIIGITERSDIGALIVYDEDKIISKLVDEMSGDESEDDKHETAVEYYEYNIKGAWVGENGPLIVKTKF